MPSPIRDRIREFRRVRGADLTPHPHNWRTHPAAQRAALRGLLAQIGYADALLARPLPDGRLQLIDGHLRAATTPHMEVPVLILDLDDQETDQLLATLDPLAAIAGQDAGRLDSLLAGMRFDHQEVVTALAAAWNRSIESLPTGVLPASGAEASDAAEPALPGSDGVAARYCVLVECSTEADQRILLDRLTAEGLSCRALIA